MIHRIAALFLVLGFAAAGWCQKDPCEGYQDSPDAPHHGPRRFNVVHVAFSGADSFVLIADPNGHRFGIDSDGKQSPREIVRGFYEDDNTAEMDTNLPAERLPRVMTIHYAQAGKYLITLTARKGKSQWLKISTSTCGQHWNKEITLPTAPAGTVTRVTLVYDPHGKEEPQVLVNERSLGPSAKGKQR
jgi:hypothetical protein